MATISDMPTADMTINGRATPVAASTVRELATKLITFLETNIAPEGLFTDDAFCDFTLPLWRLQAEGREACIALRANGHPSLGRVPRWRLDATSSGFLLEVEEEWEAGGQSWYCRELMRCDVSDSGSISAVSVYCTGDWDEAQVAKHAQAVSLIRP